MNTVAVTIIGLIVLEATNVLALYFFPGSKYANSVGILKAWETSKQDPPKSYSAVLGWMILAFILVFLLPFCGQ